jgi:polyhydroxyalkanoate synthesis regulator phasin
MKFTDLFTDNKDILFATINELRDEIERLKKRVADLEERLDWRVNNDF